MITAEQVREQNNNRELVRQAIKENPLLLEWASPALQDDKEIVLEAVSIDGGALEFSSKRLKDDKDVLITAVKQAGWTTTKSEFVDAPIINELPLTLECEMESFDEKTDIMIGKIINVSADESILTDGKIDVDKLQPLTYDAVCHHYIQLGKIVGKAFQEGLKIKK